MLQRIDALDTFMRYPVDHNELRKHTVKNSHVYECALRTGINDLRHDNGWNVILRRLYFKHTLLAQNDTGRLKYL